MRLTLADFYDAELVRHNAHLRAATRIRLADRVLDVGCGAGQTTRDAARAAMSGQVLGVDVSEPLLERARQRTVAERLHNVAYELGDAQVYPFAPRQFDVVISRFGTMFFAEPVAAFQNIARAASPGARLVMLVWQSHARNEWSTAIQGALTGGGAVPVPPRAGSDPFSLADLATVRFVLAEAGFSGVDCAEVHEPVFYGPDAESAYNAVCSMTMTREVLEQLDSAVADRARSRLRALLAEHTTGAGVVFDSRAWLVTATRC